ncbi:hypothetical protein MGU_08097 [Metarhizium guizhouense ARSEF 977]|uniref:Uncharacterized protein n=1 Tax=Metarhizium guizhouense (strain ARSEF 977) TaxID=1276136 RepID=A0A0B4GYF4_METGA|nr:hypothetical protein MGU_08097 [Metarhizium guizhouense ARSEF 977]
MVRIAMVTLMALATSTFAASHMRLRGGAKVEVARRTPEGEKTAAQEQAEILRKYAKDLEKEADKLEKGDDTSSSRPPSGNGTETADKRSSASRAGSTVSSTGAGNDPTGDGPTGGDGTIALGE